MVDTDTGLKNRLIIIKNSTKGRFSSLKGWCMKVVYSVLPCKVVGENPGTETLWTELFEKNEEKS
jgi:hypothetical protein